MMPQAANTLRRATVTSFDVAAQANVSQSTVSKALRGDPGIRSETRKRVVRAAEALGYCVDARASSLRSLRADCVAVIMVCDQVERLAEELSEGAYLIPELHRMISALGFEMLVSIQNSQSPQDSFVHRRRAETSIIIGKSATLDRWRVRIKRESSVSQFELYHEDLGDWGVRADFLSWLSSAVISEQAACEIVVSGRPSSERSANCAA